MLKYTRPEGERKFPLKGVVSTPDYLSSPTL
ncbi:MAG: hypothetical protein Ct9H90mP18_01180 [Gammaproteobacteria bacterium]|nr:MAG: hypothetical protein Ct9H90mP18_01180 [Gammaproteobacteria bacterium]